MSYFPWECAVEADGCLVDHHVDFAPARCALLKVMNQSNLYNIFTYKLNQSENVKMRSLNGNDHDKQSSKADVAERQSFFAMVSEIIIVTTVGLGEEAST